MQLPRLENETDKAYAERSAFLLRPRGRRPNRYSDAEYDKKGKLKSVQVEDEEPSRRSKSRRMRNIDYDDASEHDEIQEERIGRASCRERVLRLV